MTIYLTSPVTSSIAAVVLLLALTARTSSSPLTFTSDPRQVKTPITNSLHMRCALHDTSVTSTTIVTSQNPAGIVGRRRDIQESDADQSRDAKRSSPPTDPILHVTSMTISRGGVPIAAVSTYTPVKVESDVDRPNIKVTGAVTPVSGELGYLDIVWSFPTSSQVGQYECTVMSVTAAGHGVTVSESVVVSDSMVDIDDILAELRDLKMLGLQQNTTLADQRQTIQQQQSTIHTLQMIIQNTTCQNQSEAASLQTIIDQQQSQISDYENALSKQNSTINQQRSEITDLQTKFHQQQSQISNHRTTLNKQNSTITHQQSIIHTLETSLQNTTNEHQSEISALQTTVTQQQSQISDHENKTNHQQANLGTKDTM